MLRAHCQPYRRNYRESFSVRSTQEIQPDIIVVELDKQVSTIQATDSAPPWGANRHEKSVLQSQ